MDWSKTIRSCGASRPECGISVRTGNTRAVYKRLPDHQLKPQLPDPRSGGRVLLVNASLAPASILLANTNDPVSPEEEGRFFASLHQSNGTTRMTSYGRLDDLTAAIATHLPPISRLNILDAGISSGISSIEWLNALEALGHSIAMTAFDRVLGARLYRLGPLQVLTERQGYVLLVHTGRRALTRPVIKARSWSNRTVRAIFRTSEAAARLARVAGFGEDVPLVSRHLRSRPDVRLVEKDIFAASPDWVGHFDVVRIANLLNRSYFSESALRLGIRNAGSWVRPGGLLAVARTESDGRNHATIFRHTGTGLGPIYRLGAGSEVEALAMEP